MLYPVGKQGSEARFSLRLPSELKSFVGWMAEKEGRSENEEVLRILKDYAQSYFYEKALAFINWMVPSKGEDKAQFKKIVVYKTRPKSLRHLTEKFPLEKAPLKLYLSLCLSGLSPYAVPPGIYTYIDNFFHKIASLKENEEEIDRFVKEVGFLVKSNIPSPYRLNDITILEDETDLLFCKRFKQEIETIEKQEKETIGEIDDDEIPF